MAKVLFVDDEEFILLGLKRLIKTTSDAIDAEFAQSGKEALEKISSKNFDVIVTDLYMPGIDGVKLLEFAKETQPNAIRIMMTGHINSEIEKFKNEFAHIILSKPVSYKMLLDTISNCLSKKEELLQQ
ncbi:MAG TPA: response regulator [Candidatus Kapabacteria bacterium]|jgi:YesN/AraC family two-component response regulator|nr:response regulator [Candidatus Kapabacteria bacterium]HOM04547.1 response regulator [Candidatus Kapabacteria bacterium]HOQ49930.1 response regulator [Candidatus Kapabacteria bacterium]HPP39032.1 response regulator [Candidatus Kapabacteria bacterium]HPU23123.1 response regulator [Candidatus Kapabacteria bacterium]